LEEAIVAASKAGALPKGQDLFVSNKRHIALLSQAQEHLAAAESLLAAASDRALFHTRDARDAVRAVLGRSHDDDILESVFSRFCIGK
jgi:tRNA U34 5-carboxymethylaminomethyl modifying GTPase MnmE/TrmE